MNAATSNRRILELLRERHREDIHDAEVIAGSEGRRMDFLAIACSWARPLIVAYEIKVSRADFLQDHKWPSYLPHCKQLVFVTAPGVATLAEIPEQCGWQELSANGARLLTRKKAPARDISAEKEARLYKVLLMRKSGVAYEDPKAFWGRWLSEKRENRQIGRLVRYEIAATIADRIRKAEREAKESNARSENLEKVRTILQSMGIDPERIERGYSYQTEKTIRAALEARNSGPISKLVDEMLAKAPALTKFFEDLQRSREQLNAAVQKEMHTEDAA